MKGRPLRKITPYLYLAPAVVLALLFAYRPFLLTLKSSFYHLDFQGNPLELAGWDNYRLLMHSPVFWQSAKNTLTFTALFVPLNLFITAGCALVAHRKGKFFKAGRTLLGLPVAVAMSSTVLILKTLFNEDLGLINHILNSRILWFSSPGPAMGMLVVTGIWLDIGFDFILFSAALKNIPEPIYEAASLEGAPYRRVFCDIELPLIAPTIVFVTINSMKDALLICAPVMILTEGGPFRSTRTLLYQMYLEGFKGGNIGVASAIAAVCATFAFLLMITILLIQRKRVFYA